MKENKEKKKSTKEEEIIEEDNSINIEQSNSEKVENEVSEKETEKQEKTDEPLTETDERIAELEEKNEELNNRLLRRIAEFENYKRRTENDQLMLLKYSGEVIILKLLPVYDDLMRSLAHVDDENNTESLKNGLKMVSEKFKKSLEELEVKKIDAKGKKFDFNFHEALLRQSIPGVEADTVIEEVEPGYIYKDKVIKHTKVIVSQEPPEETEDKNSESSTEDKN